MGLKGIKKQTAMDPTKTSNKKFAWMVFRKVLMSWAKSNTKYLGYVNNLYGHMVHWYRLRAGGHPDVLAALWLNGGAAQKAIKESTTQDLKVTRLSTPHNHHNNQQPQQQQAASTAGNSSGGSSAAKDRTIRYDTLSPLAATLTNERFPLFWRCSQAGREAAEGRRRRYSSLALTDCHGSSSYDPLLRRMYDVHHIVSSGSFSAVARYDGQPPGTILRQPENRSPFGYAAAAAAAAPVVDASRSLWMTACAASSATVGNSHLNGLVIVGDALRVGQMKVLEGFLVMDNIGNRSMANMGKLLASVAKWQQWTNKAMKSLVKQKDSLVRWSTLARGTAGAQNLWHAGDANSEIDVLSQLKKQMAELTDQDSLADFARSVLMLAEDQDGLPQWTEQLLQFAFTEVVIRMEGN
ncbi:unnamed protein product [Vitrella brassicaformis CCMP3155]|uniref:Uncharacterized protein n=1 Tax=Vitrella brassicaformis (strain CCMP3155) TaxID=1169540 RepID=A0A0G4FXY3_VITBC|nr:unnamed protein product [Vitrella brassicaformis CCMP3155]|eukprot:CEM20003.1 unnamed protein product [Vitrella brassicaformis CCMP3155]